MKKLLAGAALLGTAVSAQAADFPARMYTKAAPVAAVYDWTGFYFGANVGYGLSRTRADHTFPGNASFPTFYEQAGGAVGGGQIGYNYQTGSSFLGLGPMVFGVEADFQAAGMRDDFPLLGGLGLIGTNFNHRLDWFGTARGRVGIATGPVLTYVTAGYAYGRVRTTVTEGVGAVVAPAVDITRNQGGWVIGSGIEAALGGNWTGKIEYLYMNLGNNTDAFTNVFGPQALSQQVRENIFRAGVNYRIGGNSNFAVVPANWGGFYLGGNFGSGIGRDRSTLNLAGVGTDSFNLAPDGYFGGGQIGYNWQTGPAVFGIETDIQASSQRDNRTCVASCTTAFAAAYDARLPWFGTVRGRVGYSLGSTLFYVTGGYAYGGVKTDITTGGTLAPTLTTSIRNTRGGYAVGGGIETPFNFLGLFGSNWTSKTEYLYVDLGTQSATFTVPTVAAPQTLTSTTNVREHIFRTGLNYHFNSPVVAKY